MDPIANMLTIIRNGLAVKKETVEVPYSKIKMSIIEIMSREKFLGPVDRKGRKDKKKMEISLIYDEKGKPAIEHIVRISKPSRRVYFPFIR